MKEYESAYASKTEHRRFSLGEASAILRVEKLYLLCLTCLSALSRMKLVIYADRGC